MVTIRRHPVPPDSYDPGRPLNDLVREQLSHFVAAAKRLPPELRIELPVPSPDDAAAANKFIAAVTERFMSLKRKPLKVVRKQSRKPPEPGIAIAAQAESPVSPRARPKPKAQSKPTSRRSGK